MERSSSSGASGGGERTAPGDSPAEPLAGDRPSAGVLQSATHSPAPRVVVEQEVRSVVLAAEVDDDPTPPRGTAVPGGIEVTPGIRPLALYAGSGESTQPVGGRRRTLPRRSPRLGFGPARLSPPVLVIVGLGGACLLALLGLIGWMGGGVGRDPPAPVSGAGAASAATTGAVPQPEEPTEPPVSADDLPLERD